MSHDTGHYRTVENENQFFADRIHQQPLSLSHVSGDSSGASQFFESRSGHLHAVKMKNSIFVELRCKPPACLSQLLRKSPGAALAFASLPPGRDVQFTMNLKVVGSAKSIRG